VPKATLEFNLPEENSEHMCAVTAQDMNCALWDIQQMLRNKYKYGTNCNSSEELIGQLYDQFFEIINTYGIDLNRT
jgi:hypothetical protein